MLLKFKRFWHFSGSPVVRCSPKLELYRSYKNYNKMKKAITFFGLSGLHNIKHSFAEEELWGRKGWEAEVCGEY